MSTRWSKEEIEFLMNHWGFLSLKAISKKLNRTEEAVLQKSKKLRLGGIYQSEYLSARAVARLLKVDNKTVIRWGRKHNLPLREKKFKNKTMNMIKIEQLTEWLKDNQERWDSRRLELYGLGVEPKWLKDKRKLDREIPTKRFVKWTKEEDKKAIGLYKIGRPIKDIAKDLNRSHASVERRLSRLDVWGTGEYIRN